MQGYAYTRDNNGTKEVVVFDKNTGKTVALASFSGYLALSGGMISKGLEAAGSVTKGTIIGKIYAITDGVISGVFDKQGNPDKNSTDVIGTSATAMLIGEIGAVAGSFIPGIGTTIGAVIGGVVGAIAGSVVGENAYEGIIDAISKAIDLADEAAKRINNFFDNKNPLPPFMDNKSTIPSFPLSQFENPFTLPTIYDPLILDLDNDGIETTTLDNGVYFDHNSDNISFKTSWVGNDDALLVVDKNLNNQIDDGNELFGNFTKLNNTNNHAINGFHALKEYDTNKDNIIDINDKEFKTLKLWQDKNSNALVDDNELFSLEEKGIKSINLNHKISNEIINTDNTKELTSTFTKFDGTTGEIADINLKVNKVDSIYKKDTILDEKYINLPYIKGYGFLRDLNKAASLSTSLYNTLKTYINATTKDEQIKLLQTLVKEWSDTTSKNNSYSLQKSTIINNNMPEIKIINLVDKLNSDTSINKDIIYNEIINLSKNSSDERFKDGNYLIEILKNNNNQLPNSYTAYKNIRLTPSENNSMMNEKIDDGLLKEFDSIKYKLQIIDNFRGEVTPTLYYNTNSDIKDIINNINKAYDDILDFTYKSLLTQTRLKEYIGLIDLNIEETTNSNDNNISYKFNLNYDKAISKFNEINKTDPKKAFTDLADFITLFENKNDIVELASLFSNFINQASKDGNLNEYKDLIYKYNTLTYIIAEQKNSNIKGYNSNDIIYGNGGDDTIEGYGGDDTLYGGIDNDTLLGGDGKDTLYGNEGGDKLHGGNDDDILNGNEGNDYLYGNNGNDTLLGGEGSDKLYGEYGNDTLIGGKGNDYLDGGYNDDTYIFARGDGQDIISDNSGNNIIKFQEGIAKEDILATRIANSNDLKITIKNSNDSLYINNAYNNFNIKFSFSDNTILTLNDIALQVDDDDNSNNLKGYNSNDIIYGNGGDDTIEGYGGDDTLYGGIDNDTLLGGDGKDTLYGNEGGDKLHGGNDDDILNGNEGNDYLYGNNGNDTLLGGEGSDKLYGEYGNDTLIGGKGNDYLDGGYNDDTYIFARGDGQDIISDNSGNNIIKFQEGIAKEDILATRIANSNDLKITIKNSNDSLYINNAYNNFNIKFSFSDNTILTLNDIALQVDDDDNSNNLKGYNSNDIIYGNGGDDTIEGYGGDDTLYGGIDNDTLLGGDGKDTLYGNEGGDKLHGGNDDDILNGNEGNDYLYGNNGNDTLLGGEGSDKLYGEYGNDTLIGGKGNDYLDGGYNDDTYIFARGDGQDIISDNSGNNIIKFQEGIAKEDILATRIANSNDLKITIKIVMIAYI
ncbi:Ig family protein [Campylobacter sputorum subsp. bubulus]|uniref:calcium-binding protein n=1 Tax=Campylobacter sputorum TaxID=206 RepID=UPI000E13F25A|nr:calcium-binding protein [Campylobacter sputorum]SUX09577.1 Ig family protein [Campylobacter sputorum subsp. bubulus]